MVQLAADFNAAGLFIQQLKFLSPVEFSEHAGSTVLWVYDEHER